MSGRALCAGLGIAVALAGCPTLAAQTPPQEAADDAKAAAAEAIALARRYAAAELPRQALEVLSPHRTGPAAGQVLAETAGILFESGDFDGAAEAYRALLARLPGRDVVQRNLLIALMRGFRDDEARTLLEEMGSKVERMARAQAVRGVLAARAGDVDSARADLEAAVALAPEDDFAPYELGLLHLASGDAAAAVVPLREAVRRDPGYAQAQYNLGQALLRSGDRQGGEAALAAARRITAAANERQTRQRRAVALAMRAREAMTAGDTAAALRDLDEALRLLPGDAQLTAMRDAAHGDSGG